MDINGKVVLITGASSGIGAATAIHLSKLSAKLALVGRKESNLKRVALYVEKAKGIKPLEIVADITDDAQAERVISETVERFGALDALINCAGVLAAGGLKDGDMAVFDRVMAVNVRAAYRLTSLAAPHLARARGCVLNVTCGAGTRPGACNAAYSVSKAALEHLTRCAALELAPAVRVLAVSPGAARTGLLRGAGLTDDQRDLFLRGAADGSPLRRTVEADEVAAFIAFLVSERAQSITGVIIPIDAGTSLK